jgi:hypothetical protein
MATNFASELGGAPTRHTRAYHRLSRAQTLTAFEYVTARVHAEDVRRPAL